MKRYVLLVCVGYGITNMQLINAETQSTTIDHRDCILLNTEDNKDYTDLRATGITQLNSHDSEDFDDDLPLRKVKKRLTVDYLNVVKNLVVNGTAVTGTSTSTNLASYGQLFAETSQTLTFDDPDTWIPLVFDTASLSSGITLSTTSPGTITIQNSGTYQINVNLCILLEDSPEEAVASATYTFGLSVNGVITPVIALDVEAAGYCPFNYNNIRAFSANDEITFYMKATRANPDPLFDNHVTVENGYAYLAQIS